MGGRGEMEEDKLRLKTHFKEALFLIQRVPASGEGEGWQIPGVWTGSLRPTRRQRQCVRAGKQLGSYW